MYNLCDRAKVKVRRLNSEDRWFRFVEMWKYSVVSYFKAPSPGISGTTAQNNCRLRTRCNMAENQIWTFTYTKK